jgi:hypothetical protein
MPRPCSVCVHPERQAIDTALAAGGPLRALGAKYGVSPDALKRHKAAHLPVRLVQKQVLREAQGGLDLTRQLVDVNAAALEILAEARDAAQPETALRAIDRVVKTLDLQARLVESQHLEERIAALEAKAAAAPPPVGGRRWGT